jgi:hypothetical protein
VLQHDAEGYAAISLEVAEQFRRNYQAFGYLSPRGSRSLTMPSEACTP